MKEVTIFIPDFTTKKTDAQREQVIGEIFIKGQTAGFRLFNCITVASQEVTIL